MNVLEKELEDLIWGQIENCNFYKLYQKGLLLDPNGRYYRQFNFGSYGIADIVGFYLEKSQDLENHYIAKITIIELKKEKVNQDTLMQAMSYGRAAEIMVENYSKGLRNKTIETSVNFVLIGKKIDSSTSFCYYPNLFERIRLLTYSIDFSTGIEFEERRNYSITSHSLPNLPLFDRSIIIEDD